MNKPKRRNESQISVLISFKVFAEPHSGRMNQCTMGKKGSHGNHPRNMEYFHELNSMCAIEAHCTCWWCLLCSELKADWAELRVNWIVELLMTWISFFHIDLGNPSLDAFFLRNVDLSLIPIHLQGIIRTICVIVLGIISKLHNYQPSVFLWKLISI